MCSNDVDMEVRGRMLNIFNSACCHSTARFAPINFDLQEIREKSTAKRKRGAAEKFNFLCLNLSNFIPEAEKFRSATNVNRVVRGFADKSDNQKTCLPPPSKNQITSPGEH